MNAILAILILGATFSVAVETPRGYVQKSFANTRQGAEEFWAFAEPLLKRDGRKVKVCTVSLVDDTGAIMEWLLEEEFGPAILSRNAYQVYVSESAAPLESAETAAKACLSRMPFIRGPKK